MSKATGSFVAEELNIRLDKSLSTGPFWGISSQFNRLSDTFNCSKLKAKFPDATICLKELGPRRNRRHHPIAIEVAYRHETFVKLLHEGCHLLSPNSDIQFVFLLFIVEDSQNSDVEKLRLTVLERTSPNMSNLLADPELNCLPSSWDIGEKENDLAQEDLQILPVNILFEGTFTEDTIAIIEDTLIEIDLDKINSWYGLELFKKPQKGISVKCLIQELVDQIRLKS